MNDDAVTITCAVNGVLTDPRTHPVPVTPAEIAQSVRRAYDAGATIAHIHWRRQEPGRGHLGSWDPDVAGAIVDAVREAVPDIIVNATTGAPGRDVSGPIACLRRVRPEMAAANAGSLNYLKAKADGTWAWPPMLFDNTPDKLAEMLAAMREVGAVPEFECFDTGIVRSVGLYVETRMTPPAPYVNFVMGVASGMPADAELLPILLRHAPAGASWQVTAIGRQEIWPLHQRCAELGGQLRSGLEDTFYLPDGTRATENAQIVEALADCARRAGRRIAAPAEARARLAAHHA